MTDTQAKMSFEIEIQLAGTFQRGYAATGPTYASGGEPGEPDGMEDMRVTDIGYLKLARMKVEGTVGAYSHRYDTLSITEGVDMNNAEVRKLLANLLNLVHDDAELALLDEARS
jgi:hypothetical protein